MKPLRPIGHIASSLTYLAVSIAYRVRLATNGHSYACWIDDDGCVYLALTTHPRAAAMARSAREQRIAIYRKPHHAPFPLTASDITDDLQHARADFALRTVHQATQAAA